MFPYYSVIIDNIIQRGHILIIVFLGYNCHFQFDNLGYFLQFFCPTVT